MRSRGADGRYDESRSLQEFHETESQKAVSEVTIDLIGADVNDKSSPRREQEVRKLDKTKKYSKTYI